MKARTLFDTKHAGDATDYPADHATNDRADRTGGPFAVTGTPLNTTRDALGLGYNGNKHCNNNCSRSDYTANHGTLLNLDEGMNTSGRSPLSSQAPCFAALWQK